MELTVVIPLMNEEDNIEPLFSRLRESLTGYSYELLFIDDGSTDATASRILKYADEKTHLISFNRNYGQTAAMAAGIEHAQGEFIATIDGDLQNDPSDIPMMLEKMKAEGWDVVAGNRKKEKTVCFYASCPVG